MGGTRAARRAGEIAETNVMTVPTISETMIVRGSICREPLGRSAPNSENRPSSGFTIAMPSIRPTSDEKTPTTSASSATDPTTWRPDAPSARNSPSSRARCCTVIENVL